MGKITFTFEGDETGTVASGGGFSVVKTTAQGDSDRLVACAADLFKDRWRNEDGSYRTPNKAEVLTAMADSVVAGWRDTLLNWEKDQSAKAVVSAVQPISVT